MQRDRLKPPLSELSARPGFADQLRVLPLTVLFTNVPDTLEALRQAACLAAGLDVSLRVLVTQVVPYPLPIDQPSVAPEFHMRHFHAICQQAPVQLRIDVRLCRDARRCIHDALSPNSLVVIGGQKSWWPFSRDKNIARSLRRAGHQVISAVAG